MMLNKPRQHMKYKALIIDFDGTTIKNGQYERPTPSVIQAIQKAKQNLMVCGATGRPFSTAKWIFNDLQLTSPSIISAGTKIVDPKTGEILWQITMPKDIVAKIISTAEKYPFQIITESQLVTFPWKEDRVLQDESVIYIVEIPKEDSQAIIEDLQKIEGIVIHTVKGYEDGNIDIHITNKNGTKEHAIAQLKKLLYITTEEIIGVGDSYNDLPLFEAVGLKAAMGNGAEQLKANADYIAPSVDEDGLVDVIEKFIL